MVAITSCNRFQSAPTDSSDHSDRCDLLLSERHFPSTGIEPN